LTERRKGIEDWEELQAFARQAGQGQIAEQVQRLGYEVAWGISYADVRIGTYNYLLAHRPQDAESEGGLALFVDGSVKSLSADELKRWLDIRASQHLPDREFLKRFPELDRSRKGRKTDRRATASTRPGRKDVAPADAGSALKVGQRAKAEWAGSWEEVEVLELLPNDKVRIRWVGWGSGFDETVSRSKLRVPRGGAETAEANKTDAKPPSGDKRLPPIARMKRMWSDASGQFQVMAELVEHEDGQVTLKKEDGSLVKLPEQKLSRGDQAFLRMIKEIPDF
jgi:hypothetical protein